MARLVAADKVEAHVKMKPYASPPLWLMLGFLSGWLYAKPSLLLGIVWGVALLAMLSWIMGDVETMRVSENEDG